LRVLLETGAPHSALEWLKRASSLFPSRLLTELCGHGHPGDARAIEQLVNLARLARVPPVVAVNTAGAKTDPRIGRYEVRSVMDETVRAYIPPPFEPSLRMTHCLQALLGQGTEPL
jgi:hypothetical protein